MSSQLVKLTKEQSEIIFGKLFKETGFEPSTRSLERQGDQRLCLLSETNSINDQLNLIKWAKENLPIPSDTLNAFLDALTIQIHLEQGNPRHQSSSM